LQLAQAARAVSRHFDEALATAGGTSCLCHPGQVYRLVGSRDVYRLLAQRLGFS
jgi:hypothetical protein